MDYSASQHMICASQDGNVTSHACAVHRLLSYFVCPWKERGELEYERCCKQNIFFLNEIAGAGREERKVV